MAAATSGTATMSAVSAWYRNQNRFLSWRRNQYTPRTDEEAQQRPPAITMAQVANNNDNNNNNNQGNTDGGAIPSGNKDKRKQDTLFGPNIGILSGGPEWTESGNEKPVDELTPEIVKSWIAKSKETIHSTTTLQALVNLKRPTLRLSPLSLSSSDDEPIPSHAYHHHHGLEFEYDCDSPKCGIYVHIILSPSHHLSDPALSMQGKPTRLLVFEMVTQGGFGKILRLEEGAMLELGRFDHRSVPPTHGHGHSLSLSLVAGTSGEGHEANILSSSEDPAGDTPGAPEGANNNTTGDPTHNPAATQRHKKRFTKIHFRKRTVDHSVAGPALAVVDAESPNSTSSGTDNQHNGNDNDEKKEGGGKGEDVGVKVTIRLAALNEEAKELSSVNEQTTYLHIVRFGALLPANGGAEGTGAGNGQEGEDGGEEEDKRPWVVKVVKREATIGPHTFHLHEIYGLSSNSTTATHAVAPTTAPPAATEEHSYPPPPSSSPPPSSIPLLQQPTLTTQSRTQQPTEDEPSSECLLCLSSPREVVLLPCRHLVACRECAVNMIEFGAGGAIVHSEPDPPPAAPTAPTEDAGAAGVGAGGGGGGEGENQEGGVGNEQGGEGGEQPTPVPVPVVQPTAPITTRRKRKAKGWFCPVCRQPYTSLLRITTTPPSKDLTDDEHRESSELGDGGSSPSPVEVPGSTPPVLTPSATAESGGNRRPGFLRAFSRGGQQVPVDVENGVAA